MTVTIGRIPLPPSAGGKGLRITNSFVRVQSPKWWQRKHRLTEWRDGHWVEVTRFRLR